MAAQPVFDGELLKSGSPGADEEWARLWTYLYMGKELNQRMEESPLGLPCMKILLRDSRENEFNEFVEYVTGYYLERYSNRKLFEEYDPEKGSVVRYLCSNKYLYGIYQGYKSRSCEVPPIGDSCGPDFDPDLIPWYNPNASNELKPDDQELDNPEPDYSAIEEYLSRLIKQLFIKKDPQKKEGRCCEHAGLQLYPRLVKTEEEYRDILDRIHRLVSNALSITTIQSKKCIEKEHIEAQESLSNKIDELEDKIKELDDKKFEQVLKRNLTEKQIAELEVSSADREHLDILRADVEKRNKNIHNKNISIEDNYRRSSDCRFRKFFAPLSEEVVIKLCNFKRCNAAQIMSRYKKHIKELIDRTAGEEKLGIMKRLEYL